MSRALSYDLKPESDRIVAAARREGRLPPLSSCEACGESGRRLVRHHHDYAKPLDTITLCCPCHGGVHAGAIPEPRTGRVYPKKRKRPSTRRARRPGEVAILFRLHVDLKNAAKKRAALRDLNLAQYLRSLIRADLQGGTP